MLSRASLIYLATPKEFFSRVRMRWIGRHIPRSDAQSIGGLLAQPSPDQVNAYVAVVEEQVAELNQL